MTPELGVIILLIPSSLFACAHSVPESGQHWVGLYRDDETLGQGTSEFVWVDGRPVTWTAWSSRPVPVPKGTLDTLDGAVTDEGKLLVVDGQTKHPFICYHTTGK